MFTTRPILLQVESVTNFFYVNKSKRAHSTIQSVLEQQNYSLNFLCGLKPAQRLYVHPVQYYLLDSLLPQCGGFC